MFNIYIYNYKVVQNWYFEIIHIYKVFQLSHFRLFINIKFYKCFFITINEGFTTWQQFWVVILDVFFCHFTMGNSFWTLKTKEKVLWPNGHRFWEVIFWSFFAHFTILKLVFGSKNERKGFMTKRTPVSRSHFFIIFCSFYDL